MTSILFAVILADQMGRVPKHVTEARREKLRALLESNRYLPLGEVCERLGISEATARRDLGWLERQNLIRRTHGGALGSYSGELRDFEAFFPTFDQRRRDHPKSKDQLASAACDLLKTGQTVFIDSGSTCFAVAEEIERRKIRPLNIVTHNIAVAVKLAEVEGLKVHVVGGTLLPRQAAAFGDEACRAVSGWHIDWAIMSCEAMESRGLWNSQNDVVRLQRAALAAAERHAFLVDASKIGHQAPFFLATLSSVDLLITDSTPENLARAGVTLAVGKVILIQKQAEAVVPTKKRGSK